MAGAAPSDAPCVLLDVDGVLHPLAASGHPLYASMDDLTLRTNADALLPDHAVGGVVDGEFMQDNMAALAYILRATGASVILSSTWRETGPQRRAVDAMLLRHGLPASLGVTPRLSTLEGGRAAEILAWAAERDDISWVAIDDLDLTADLPSEFFVQTDPGRGLTMADAERAIALLSAQARRCAPAAEPPRDDNPRSPSYGYPGDENPRSPGFGFINMNL